MDSKESLIRVFVIDDNRSDYILIREMLAQINECQFHAEWAQDYQTGLEVLLKKTHDVYLIDYHLGPANGLDLICEAFSQGCLVPIVFITGEENCLLHDEAIKAGAIDYLVKDKLNASLLEHVIYSAIKNFPILQKMREREEQFRILFNENIDGILIGDKEGCCLQANQAAADILGYPMEQLVQMKFPDLFFSIFHPIDPIKNGESLTKKKKEYHFFGPEGDHRVVETSSCHFSAQLYLSILRDVTECKNLERDLLEMQENERQRIGQDLHDGICQQLMGILFLNKTMEQKLEMRENIHPVEFSKVTQLIEQSIGQIHDIAQGLYPKELQNKDLYLVINEYAKKISDLFNVQCQLQGEKIDLITDDEIVHLYRITQEAVQNAIRHGEANSIMITLQHRSGINQLAIRDDGLGLNHNHPLIAGMGLRVMNYRARMLGGCLKVMSHPEGGTLVTCLFTNSENHKTRNSYAQNSLVEKCS